jgi:hypothetical protein
MRKVQVFILVFALSISVLFGLLAVGVYLATLQPNQYPSTWSGQMWGGMGGMMGNGNTASTATYFWLIPAALIGIGVISGLGVAFYLAFPEIRTMKEPRFTPNQEIISVTPPPAKAEVDNTAKAGNDPYKLIERTMTPDEKKVMDVLISHDGKYLQKYVKSETGLSRLQTHRIIARFADRGIVEVRQVGNTNEILVSDWIKSCKAEKNH